MWSTAGLLGGQAGVWHTYVFRHLFLANHVTLVHAIATQLQEFNLSQRCTFYEYYPIYSPIKEVGPFDSSSILFLPAAALMMACFLISDDGVDMKNF
jgi:hypothetical protein